MTRYAVAFGSNLGDRAGQLRSALDEVSRLGEIAAISGLYETAPIGGPEQDPFLNAVIVIDSDLGPETLLDSLGGIEDAHGRVRSEKWGPRTLDLDIITSDGPVLDTPRLQVPHARARERRFVIEPLAEVWPNAPVGAGLNAAQTRDQVAEQDVELLAASWVEDGAKVGRYWVMAQFLLLTGFAVALVMDGSLPGASGDLDFGGGPDGWRILGAVILAVGGMSVAISARSLGRALTAMPEPVRGATLVESGPYRYVRHPIYGAIILIVLGASLLLASTVGNLMSLGLLGLFWAKSSYEERQLRIVYPQYWSYRRRVTKRFIPFLV